MATTLATKPQHATFARSKDDVLSALSFYFGQPVNPEMLRDYNDHHAATYHFPDAYAGQNTQLRDTINNLVEKEPQQWHTGIGLPFRRIEGTVVEWDEIAFDVRLMNRVPYEGVSRMTTSTKRKHRDRVVRRGLAMLIESDFYTTPAGQQHFANQLQSIRYCVQETCNYDVLFAYLSTHNYDFSYDKSHLTRRPRNIRQAMQQQIAYYCAAQRDERGLEKVVEDAKYRMSRYGVTLALYMTLAPESRITFKEGGPTAVVNFEAGPEGFTTRAFRGCGVVTSDPFNVADDSEAVQMLQRYTQVGEFYIMSKPAGVKAGQKGFMDIVLYDEESDRHVTITYRQALIATGAFADDTLAAENGDLPMGSLGATAAAKPTIADGWLKNAKALLDKNEKGADANTSVLADAPVVLARPFIEHSMLSAVLTVAGQDTGATLFGPSDMQLSANTAVKTIEGHYTGHFKAVVTKPQNVYVLKDIMANGYRAGGNCKFFCPNGSFDEGKRNLQKRLNFEDDEDSLPSMFAFPAPKEQIESGKLDTAFSVTQRLLPYEVTQQKHEHFPGGEAMHKFYMQKLGLNAVHFGEDMRATENMEFISQGTTNNALCFLGPHRKFSPIAGTDGAYTALVPGQGHWGPDARPGDARWRRGESVSMQSAREQMLTYEQLSYVPKPTV